MVNVRSAKASAAPTRRDDVTARARIRDAAIHRFATDGFDVGLRAIAADAGVSPALVVHHFGSKETLRDECDAHVMAVVREAKGAALGPTGPDQLLLQLSQVEEYAPMTWYVLQALRAGGRLAQHMVELFEATATQFVADGVAAGTLRASRDEAARIRYLTRTGLGGVLVALAIDPPADPSDLSGWLRRYVDDIALPSFELFTEGLLADRRMLDAYLLYVGDPPERGERPGPTPDPDTH